jgi:nucleoside-diphosphate-sugar epimerase
MRVGAQVMEACHTAQDAMGGASRARVDSEGTPGLLVVGAGGFLGAHCAAEARHRGWRVSEWLSSSDDGSRWLEQLRQGAFGAVINAAAAPYRMPEVDCLDSYVQSNILLPQRLADAAGASRTPLVHVGTRWSLGANGAAPNSLYGATKAVGDYLATRSTTVGFAGAADEQRIVVRVRDMIGPGDRRRKLPSLLAQAASTGVPLPMTAGDQLLDPQDVRDVAAALVKAAACLTRDESLPVFTEIAVRPMSIRQFVHDWERATGLHVPVHWGQLAYRGTELFAMPLIHPVLPTFSARAREETYRSTVSGVAGARDIGTARSSRQSDGV